VHYCKLLLDQIFGRQSFLNEIIWAYDYGGRTKKRWPPKHDNILVYVKDPAHYTFNLNDIDRIPYMALDWWDRKRRRGASSRPIPGGTRSWLQMGKKRPVIRLRNRSAF